jgi:hypothetical protein
MTSENTKLLYNKYPLIFQDHNKSMKETAMCWGFECSDGWFNLIDNLCDKIQTHINENNVQQVIATQVKEKFGGLSFYYHGGDDYIRNLVHNTERESYSICERCGTKENIGHTSRWIITLCKECYEKTDKRLDFKLK